jgi:hypothetical protein
MPRTAAYLKAQRDKAERELHEMLAAGPKSRSIASTTTAKSNYRARGCV